MSLWWSGITEAVMGGAAFTDRGTGVLSSGVLDASAGPGIYAVDTEGAASTDDLTQITGLAENEEIVLRMANAAREVTVKVGANMKIQADYILDTVNSRCKLMSKGSDVMAEISRTNSPI